MAVVGHKGVDPLSSLARHPLIQQVTGISGVRDNAMPDFGLIVLNG